jgi:hypothetical protein
MKLLYYLIIGIVGIVVFAIYVLHAMYVSSEHDLLEINVETMFTLENFLFAVFIVITGLTIGYILTKNEK